MTYEKIPPEELIAEEEALLISESVEFQPITEAEEQELLSEQVIDIPQEPNTLTETTQESSSRVDTRHPVGPGNDGVFANMSAKPAQGKVFEEIEPPSYHEVVVDPSPDYMVSCVDENGEILIEGFPVGDYFLFFLNMFISMTFDVLGFFMTTLLATSHAARYGSQSGLGMTLMRYGFLLRKKVEEMNFSDIVYQNGYRPDPDEERSRREWTAYFILFIGVFILLRANIEFYRLRRMRSLVGSAAPPLVV